MSTTTHLRMRGVSKAYRFFQLQGISFDLEPGEVLGLVGPNGAGKSTTIRMAMGMLAPDAGEIRVLGHAMPSAQAEAKRDVGYVSADLRLVPNATLGWHMAFVSSVYPAGPSMSAVEKSSAGAAAASESLSDRDREILALERLWWQYAGAKEQAIRDKFDMSATRYYQVLNALIDREDALAFDPLLVKRLRRLRAQRQRSRSARRLGIDL